MYVVRVDDTAMPDRMHITGARTNISRTITPFTHHSSNNDDDQVNIYSAVVTSTIHPVHLMNVHYTTLD